MDKEYLIKSQESIDEKINRRNLEIINITNDLKELAEINAEINKMVGEQGEQLNYINQNIENSEINIDNGLNELSKAFNYSKTTLATTVFGCIIGGAIGGPIGAASGMKVGGAIGLGAGGAVFGGSIGYISQNFK